MTTTPNILDQVDLVNNPEQKTSTIFLFDVSGSTAGKRNEQLNRIIPKVMKALQEHPVASKRCEITTIAFNDEVRVLQEFVSPDQFIHSRMDAGGGTSMGAAINKGLDMTENRKAQYKTAGVSYTRPLGFLLTDGEPTDDIRSAAQRVRQYEREKKVAFFALGLDGANLEILSEICAQERPPKAVDENRYEELIKWFSDCLIAMSTSRPGEQTTLPPASGWEKV